MRQIILDTETTGLSHEEGDRIIEIGCIELKSRQMTKNHFHHYINPERDVPEEAIAIHGITNEFLADKPGFAEIAEAFCDYIRGAELIIHNAPFDVGFLNAELARLGLPRIDELTTKVTDTLAMARDFFPGRRNSLDALCERYEIDNTHRELHGALVDSALLGEVYLTMTRGQEALGIELASHLDDLSNVPFKADIVVRKVTPKEEAEHEAYLDEISKKAKAPIVWRRQD
ncbi:DNA polymerase III subunit epsilon [Oxalobacter sp. OttesenSCG-928-P03]|nr:DNA polymerase III subunit epsilon [Oxalobacter sp. OttesenSCG-928-P03]